MSVRILIISGEALGVQMLISDPRTNNVDSIKLADIASPSTVTPEGKAAQKYARSLLWNNTVYLDIDNSTTSGRNEWSQLIMTVAPYVFDLVSIAVGLHVLRQKLSRNAFLVGFLFMLLCLRPTFDFVCETIGFAAGFRGDLFHIALTVGGFATWAFLALSIAFAIYAITVVIGRFKGFPQNAEKAAT